MAEEVLRKLVERSDRDRQRQADQEQSIKATEYIGNGYVKQIGQAPTRSRYLGNAGLVPGELVAPLGHGQQDVITHKKPVAFTASSQPQETIGIIPGAKEIIYDSWTDKPNDWYQYFDGGESFRIVWKNPPPTATPGNETFTYTQTITIPFSGQVRIATTGVDDRGSILLNNRGFINFNYPGTGLFFDFRIESGGEYPLFVSVSDTTPGGAGIGFRIEFVPDIIYISEE